MLHVGVLPNHRSWGDVLANLAWVVVDEAHVYRGVFGSHVANVLRRLRRLARAYGTEPRFVLTSATIANPLELGERLTGLEMLLVDRDGAPRAEREIVMWNPPLVDEKLGKRASALSEAAELLAELVEREVRTICFLKSRRGVELIQRFTRLRLEDAGRADLAERIAPYRAGYTPAAAARDRAPPRRGRAAGGRARPTRSSSASTSATLDAAICVTFPGTVARLRQMWGRAGPPRRRAGHVRRRRGRARPVLLPPPRRVPRPSGRAARSSTTSPRRSTSPTWRGRLRAAAARRRTRTSSAPRWERTPQRLVKLGELRERGGRYLPRGPGYPAGRIALRSASPDSVAIVETDGRRADRHGRGRARALRRPPGRGLPAHGRRRTRSRSSTCATAAPLVRPFEGDWYTQPKTRDRHLHRAGARAARVLGGRRAVLRDRVGDRAGRSPTSASASPTTR